MVFSYEVEGDFDLHGLLFIYISEYILYYTYYVLQYVSGDWAVIYHSYHI